MSHHLVVSGLSSLQRSVCELRLSGASYARIIKALSEIKYNRQISMCLTSAAADIPWELREPAGRQPYLCPEDEDAFVRMIVDAQQNLIPIPILRLLEEVQRMKEPRHQATVHFLKACRSVDLLVKFPVGNVDCPSRSWVNWFCERRELRLSYARTLDRARIARGTNLAIRMFYT
jgi:hypothetical protein